MSHQPHGTCSGQAGCNEALKPHPLEVENAKLRAEVEEIVRKYTVLLEQKLEVDGKARDALRQVRAFEAVVNVAKDFARGDIHPIAQPLWDRLQAALADTTKAVADKQTDAVKGIFDALGYVTAKRNSGGCDCGATVAFPTHQSGCPLHAEEATS